MLFWQPAKPNTTVRVEVTAEDIDLGIQGTMSGCPIARAIKRATGVAWLIGGRGGIGVYPPALSSLTVAPLPVAPLPQVAQAFAAAFDEGRSVAPFVFYVDLPA